MPNNLFKIVSVLAVLSVFTLLALARDGRDFLLQLAHLILVEFFVPVAWPLAAIAIAFILRAQIGNLVLWATRSERHNVSTKRSAGDDA